MGQDRRITKSPPNLVNRSPEEYASELYEFLVDVEQAISDGVPTEHAITHLQEASDPLAAPTSVTDVIVGTAGTIGTANNYALADHRHGIDEASLHHFVKKRVSLRF